MSTRLMHEMERAAEQEQGADALRAEIERLKSELARLTPSGQVAEDVEMVRAVLGVARVPAMYGDAQDAISRLAAKAQGYEAMKAERDHCRNGWSNADSQAERYAAERDAAVADNAVLLRRIGDIQSMVFSLRVDGHEGDEETGAHEPDCGRCARDGIEAAVADALSGPHLGAALLAEHAKALEASHADGRRHALLQALDRLGMDSACMYGDPTATDTRLSDELWNHVSWLEVRARNEGREDAVAELKSAAYSETGDMITRIRAKKEPES